MKLYRSVSNTLCKVYTSRRTSQGEFASKRNVFLCLPFFFFFSKRSLTGLIFLDLTKIAKPPLSHKLSYTGSVGHDSVGA